jgi:hypothetical protein
VAAEEAGARVAAGEVVALVVVVEVLAAVVDLVGVLVEVVTLVAEVREAAGNAIGLISRIRPILF